VNPSDEFDGVKPTEFHTKKCPHCFVYLALSARKCHYCKANVGEVNLLGFAEKLINWRSYVIAGIAILVFVGFVWWAFILLE